MAAITNVIVAITTTEILTSAASRLLSGPLYVKNVSPEVVKLIVAGSDPIDLHPGEPQHVLPGQLVTGTSVSGTAKVQVYSGIIPTDESAAMGPGVSAEDPLYAAPVSSFVTATERDLLARILIELKINNLYNSLAHNAELTSGDLGVDTDYLV